MSKTRLLVTVCDHCLQASCWQGIFMCDESRYAGTVDLPLTTVRRLALENQDYWTGAFPDPQFTEKTK